MSKRHDDDDAAHKRRWRPFAGTRNNFLAGLVVVVPIAITMWLIWTFVGWIDSWVLPFVPGKYHPDSLLKYWFSEQGWYIWLTDGEDVKVNIRGVGVVVFLIFTIIVGWIAKGLIGRSFIAWGESMVDRMPIVRSLYNGIKQIAETVFSQSQEAKFDKACLVEYPRKGIWAIAFISTKAKGEIDTSIPVDEDAQPDIGLLVVRAAPFGDRIENVGRGLCQTGDFSGAGLSQPERPEQACGGGRGGVREPVENH